MDTNHLQTIRYKLQKRLKRLNTADWKLFHDVLAQTWGFLSANPIMKGILDELELGVRSAEKDSESILKGQLLVGESELEQMALCYWVVKRCATGKDRDIERNIGHALSRESKFEDSVEYFRQVFVEPLFDYIDEQIDDHRTTLALLGKYKHRAEWFFRDELRQKFEAETQKGEKTLAMNLYCYLHDQGLEFYIEPSSISGEADLISAQSGPDRLVADVKVFDPSKSKGISYICSGFNQVYQYMKDYNESFGYLVIFKTCREDLSVNTSSQDTSVPFVTHNNKTIFLLVIDIFNYPEPASKRGILKAYELMPDELVRMVTEAHEQQPQA